MMGKPEETIQVKNVDNRTVVEVKGKHIVLSEIKPRVEAFLANSAIEEVRMFAGFNLKIDADLSRDVWHGRNLVVLANEIKVLYRVTWDVSGKDNNLIYMSDAGKDINGHGKGGNDGYPGESGGNVLLQANSIQDPDRLTIISNGGNGSSGQNGGEGKDGADGKGLTEAEFKKKFPHCLMFFRGERIDLVKRIITNMYDLAQHIPIEWMHNKARFRTHTSHLLDYIKFKVAWYFDIFIKVVRQDGGEIIFSLWETALKCHSFLVYKGAPGQHGKPGGGYGMGGQGGFPGEIIIQHLNDGRTFGINTSKNWGNNGNNGTGGLYGRHGKNGWDIGFLGWLLTEPTIYGTDLNSKLQVHYYRDSSSNRIYCPYQKKYGNDIYAGIGASRNVQTWQEKYRDRNNTQARRERQHHSKAIGRKSIPRVRIVAAFSEYLQQIEKERQELEKQYEQLVQQHSEIEKQRLEAQRIENEKQESVQQKLEYLKYDSLQQVDDSQHTNLDRVAKLDIKRFEKFSQDSFEQIQFDFVKPSTSGPNANHKQIIDILNQSSNLGDWLQLQTSIVSAPELISLIKLFETLKPKFITLPDKNSNVELEAVTAMLKAKDKFTILRDTSQELPLYHTKMNRISLTAENVARYLEETEEKNDTIYHPMLGSLKKYIFENSTEQRDTIIEFGLKVSKCSDNAIKRAVETFILETYSSKAANERVNQFYDEYYDYLDNQQKNIDTIIESVEAELKKQPNDELLRLWYDSVNDDTLPGNLEIMLRNDKALSSLYDKLTVERNTEYNWERCCADVKIQEIFKISLEKEGIMSKSYRVLLAHVFNVNIRVYARDEKNEIELMENHNHESTTVIHVLLEVNKIIQLKINQAYRLLEEERLHKDSIYRQILTEVSTMQIEYVFVPNFQRKLLYQNSSSKQEAFEESDGEAVIGKISEFFFDEEREQIAQRLENIAPKYSGQHGVFENILQRFSYEGRHVSFNELSFLINSILTHSVQARQERYTFSWIVAAYNQCNWTDELVLLQLENFFKRQLQDKSKWRGYMSNIDNKGVLLVFAAQFDQNPCSEQCVEEILHLLSSIPIESVNLDQVELPGWPYVLKEYYWTYKFKSLIPWDNELASLSSATFYALSIENTFGDKLMSMLFESFKGKRNELTHAELNKILNCFHTQKWNLCIEELNVFKRCGVKEWVQNMDRKHTKNSRQLTVSQIVAIIKGNSNTSSNIVRHLSRIENSVANIHYNETTFNTKKVSSFLSEDIEQWTKQFQHKIKKPNAYVFEEMLAVIDRAIELKRGFRLRDTQRLTVLALLANDKSTLAQVSTGEGKTIIVVAITIIKVLLGEKVDIITSSSVLAKRDADENKDMYELFGLSASHNCSEVLEERKEAYSSNQIIYGDLGNFQRDYLLDRVYGKNVLGDRSFQNVIVDEVDSMLLDKGNNILYLSHDIAGMDKLESVFVFIWQMVNNSTDQTEDVLMKDIKQSVLCDMYALIQKEDIQSLDNILSVSDALTIWERLIQSEIINDSGRLLVQAVDCNKLYKVLSPDFTKLKDRLSFLLWSRIERETYVTVPNYLKAFVERHLDGWISSAITALYMVPGQYYVVDVDRSGTSTDRNANVIILDRDTGTDQVSSQWDEAMHQFLQLKHGCKLSTLSLKAVFISNVTYFKEYELLYGLTGTLGTNEERDLLKKIHDVDFVTVPTFKMKQFEEYGSIICSSSEDWKQEIRQEVTKLINTEKRSVLIICETVQDVEALQLTLGSEEHKNLHIYKRDYEKLTIPKDGLQSGHIIIATNLAGRGTDIKISDELEKAGGLHVVLTYLPANIRIEEQAFGRAARKGEKGSGRMIIMVPDGKSHSNFKIYSLKLKRNADELLRLATIKTYYETTIKTEENCFISFKNLYEQLRNSLDKTPDRVKEILLQSCLDKWSFWLDENNALIDKATDESDKQVLNLLLDTFLIQFKNLQASSVKNWSAWVEEIPIQMIKLGKYISQHKSDHRDTALQLFGKVISSEPYFCEAAYYYRAYVRSLGNINLKEFQNDLNAAGMLFAEHIKNTMHALGVVEKQKTMTKEYEGYKEQKESLVNLYSLFLESIDDMLGQAISPASFINYEIKEDVSEIIFKNLIRIGVIKKAEVVGNIPIARIQKLHTEYGIPLDKLKTFLHHRRGAIDEKKLLADIRRSFSFPNRSEFWNALIAQNVLHSVKHYVRVNEERLETIDPALMNVIKQKVEIGELVKEVIKLDKHQMLLIRHEQQTQHYFEKEKLIRTIGERKYNSLVENGVLSFNEKATIDKSRIDDCVFSVFDAITVQDITNKTRITTSEANNIVAELLKQNVLEQRGNTLTLTVNYDQALFLPSCPVYESVIRNVLASCFAYRLALRNISAQLEKEDCSDIHIKLHPDPYQVLFDDLYEQKIVRHPMLTRMIDESEIEAIHSKTWSEEELKSDLAKDIGLSVEYTEVLLDALLKNQWIVPVFLSELLPSATDPFVNIGWSIEVQDLLHKIKEDSYMNIFDLKSTVSAINPFYDVMKICYNLSSKQTRKSLADLKLSIESINVKHGLVESYDVGIAIEKWFNNQFLLIEKGTNIHIEDVLSKSKSLLAKLNEPSGELKSIVDFYGQNNFGNIDEMRIFITNGLEHVLQLVEKKWTLEMKLNTFLVAALGLTQIVIGAIITVYSSGFMTHVGSALISEGVSDIMFAVSAGMSGYFSWQDYGKHKLHSLAFTTATAGVGMYLSSGAKMSRIGYKLAGPTLEYGGKKVAELTGKQLIKAVGGWTVVKETAKRVALKTAEGVSFALANTAVDKIVENHLQSMLNSLALNILSGIEDTVKNHSVELVQNLQKAYDLLGENSARALVDDLTSKYMIEQNMEHIFLSYSKELCQSVMKGISNASKQTGKTSTAMVFMRQLSRVLEFVDSAAQINKMGNATQNLLNDINSEMKEKLINIEKNSAPSKGKQDIENDFELFKNKIIEQWKITLSKHVGQLIAQHVVNPVLKMGVRMATSYVSKELKNIRNDMENSNLEKKMHRLKNEHEQKIHRPDMKTATKRQLTDQYHGQLLKIMHKTRNPSLFATIIRENVPMDLICVGACTPMIHKLLQAQNPAITGLTITVHSEKGIKQSFKSGKGGPEVHLELKDNHYTVSQEQESQLDTFNNNCLYGALATAIPDLQALAPTAFRYMLSNWIKHDNNAQLYIRYGWHRFGLNHNVVGGLKEKINYTDYVADEASVDEEGNPFTEDERSALYHLRSRFQHTFRFGGEVRKGVEVTHLPVDKIIKDGASNYKASRKVKPFTGLQQAHVVRVSVDEELKTANPDVYDRITKHAGHTQLTDKSVNVFHKIGGDIDRSQHRWSVNLATIDYTKQLNSRSRKIISDIIKDTLEIYEKNIAKLKTEHADESIHYETRLELDKEVKVLERARNHIRETTIEELYHYAKEGYAERYQYIPKKRSSVIEE